MRATLALAALLLLVVAFATLAPATLLDRRLAAVTQDRVRLADASGTLWRGSGTLCDAQGRWRVPLAWKIGVLAALRGALRVELVPDARGRARGVMQAVNDTLDLSMLHVELPAPALASLWTRPPVPVFDGVLTADAPSFRTDGTRVDGALDLRWDRARMGLAGVVIDLGTVDAHARPSAGGMTVALGNRGGDVALRGEARAEGNALSLDATLTPAPTLAAPARVALRALGPAAADGGVHVTWHATR